ncbi:MAG: type III PLP-dependent enzyme [Candidatus Margulisbacteria bacterium]|nr:type III PLP-dependent enzyme [Candidatus Margulisiibacteriota bacterium]
MTNEEPEGEVISRPSIKAPKTREGIESLIRKLVKEHHTPLLLVMKSVLSKQFYAFRKKLPDVEPFYAIKSNPHPQILKHFVSLGCAFDVASAREIEWVLKAGAKPRNIIFANTIKSEQDLRYAADHRINMLTFDNELELYKIAKHCPRAKVILRIKVANIGSVVQLSLKFGADPEQATYLLKKAKTLGLQPEGVSFHVGSQCTNINNYIQALETSAKIFAEAESVGIDLKLLDIGGGFPIKHFDSEDGTVFEKMASTLRKELKRLFKGYAKLRIIAEPGRFFCGPAGILITQVVGKAFRDNKYYYYINDGVYQDFSGVLFDHCKYEFKSLKHGPKLLCTIAGPTCDSLDIISLTEELPELDINNVIYVKNIGAYSCASAVPAFNGFAPAKVLVI